MAPSPGTPVGGERAPRSPRRAAAADGAPAGMDVDSGVDVSRVYCPVVGCPCADPLRARGWTSVTTMQAHIDAHLAGSLQGDVPAAWLRAQGRQRCQICGLSVSTRHGIHPTCRPQARAAAGQPAVGVRDGPFAALPSIAEIQAGRTPTLRHVPAAARSLWCKVLTKALAAVVHYNDLCSWQELLLLPQCVLNAPPRGGRKHAKAAAAYTLDRLRRWEDGERILLWESRGRTSSKHRSLTTAERRDLATSLAREGFEGKACDGLAPETADTVAALRALHPVQPDPVAPPLHELPPSPDVVPDAVAKALQSFPSATAPGPSALRVQHLREACWPGGRDGLMVQLAGVVTLLASGRACGDAAPLLAGATLVAIPKPQGGVRPIAIGEVLRRLTGKCLMELVRADARSALFPAQVGVAVPAGSEAAVHCVRAWHERHAGAVNKVLENAFNTVSRQEVLSATCAQFPALARWVNWCYGSCTTLQFGNTALQSAAGVQQGDPLGPLLFAAALQPIAAELREGPLDLAVFYLDDGVVAGDLPSVGAALTHVQQRAAAVGLSLNLNKFTTLNFSEPPLAMMPLWPRTRPSGLPRRPLCWKPSLSSEIRRWPCACSAPVRAIPGYFTACAATRLRRNKMPLNTSTLWCVIASAASLACTWRVPNGCKQRGDSHKPAWACGPHLRMPQPLTWLLLGAALCSASIWTPSLERWPSHPMCSLLWQPTTRKQEPPCNWMWFWLLVRKLWLPTPTCKPGSSSLIVAARHARRYYCPKLSQGDVPSWQPSQLDTRGWNPPSSLLSCDIGLGWLKRWVTDGALGVMGSLTPSHYMLGSASPAVNAPNDTMPYGTCCALGRSGPAYTQRKSDLDYFSRKDLKTLGLPAVDPQTSLHLAFLASLLHLTWPWLAFSGRLA